MKSNHNIYYTKDYRTPMMLLALFQLVGLALIPVAIVAVFFNWKLAIIIAVVGVLMAWKFGDLNISLGHKLTEFSGDFCATSDVLYCDIEKPETAGKFRFVAEDIGGLFKDGENIVLGSLNGEKRGALDSVEFEVVNHSALVNYINITIGNEQVSIFPKWSGPVNEQPSSPEKADWAYNFIQELINKPA